VLVFYRARRADEKRSAQRVIFVTRRRVERFLSAWTITCVCRSVYPCLSASELDMGRVHPRVGSGQVQLRGSMWVTPDDPECYAKCNRKVSILVNR